MIKKARVSFEVKNTYARQLAMLGLLLWIAENIYFGWNAHPQSGLERLADFVSLFLMVVFGFQYAVEEQVKKNMGDAKITITEI